MLIDAFLFFNEKELTELRVKYLENIVDFFVIVEANITHQGKKKEWNFPGILKNDLKKFSNNKIFICNKKIVEFNKIKLQLSKIGINYKNIFHFNI